MADQIVITEKSSQAKDIRAAVGTRYGDILAWSRQMKRREFITLLGGGAAWPVVTHAQQPGKLPTIDLL